MTTTPSPPAAESEITATRLPTPSRSRRMQNRYDRSRIVLLLGEYWRILADLSAVESTVEDHPQSWSRIAQTRRCLDVARDGLDRRRPDTLAIAAYLSLADRLLLWLLPDDKLAARCAATLTSLDSTDTPSLAGVTTALRSASDSKASREQRCVALEAALQAHHAFTERQAIEDGLQVRRLQHLIAYSSLLILLVWGVAPMISPFPGGASYPGALILAGSIVLVGAMGGLFSRLLHVRDAYTSLLTYRTDMLKLALSLLVGGMAALVLQLLVSWQVITIFQVDNPGTVYLVAFAAGFSEKYFLRLLRMPRSSTSAGPAPPPDGPAQPPAGSGPA
ncbi:hypothetical protein [Salinactinospora qingdaonensis]|uniref:Uncharacterized protein n=1 Tax=Salinactinospora qingdaonensis TaxID=702744 RepID=A0ABP7FEU7_9ACTN